MSIFVKYPSNMFAALDHAPTTIVAADMHVLWVTSINICNRRNTPLRINLQKSRLEGSSLKEACYAATTANLDASYINGIAGLGATLTNNGTLAEYSVDGVTPPLNSRILVKDQTDETRNGIYIVTTTGDISTPWVLMRAIDFDTVAEIAVGAVVSVSNGIVNSSTKWKQTSSVIVIGISSITFEAELPSTTIFILNEFEIKPYKSFDLIEEVGVINLNFSTIPFVSDSLICFSNGYTQVFDCDANYTQLNELPLS